MTCERACIVGLFAAVTILTWNPSAARAQSACPSARLPGYSHNDYENARPLTAALDLGYRGVEADVFLVDGVLRLGHDRGRARKGRPFEAVYLAPLRALVARCAALTAERGAFLLNIELKEQSPDAFDSLAALLSRYRDILSARGDTPFAKPIEAVLVGWHPALPELERRRFEIARIQRLVTTPSPSADVLDTARIVRLISLDYGKTLGRPWTSAAKRRKWLATCRAMKEGAPDRLLRVYNVPNNARIYRMLLEEGVDLIGTKTIMRSRELLADVTGGPKRGR